MKNCENNGRILWKKCPKDNVGNVKKIIFELIKMSKTFVEMLKKWKIILKK